MGKRYTQLGIEERCAIARLRSEGRSIRQIAATLDRPPPTIARELKRNGTKDGGYRAVYAHEQAHARRWCGGRLDREDAIGRMRWFLPRKTNLASLSEREFTALLRVYNNTPRKCLGYRTPVEVLREQVLHFECESTGTPLHRAASERFLGFARNDKRGGVPAFAGATEGGAGTTGKGQERW